MVGLQSLLAWGNGGGWKAKCELTGMVLAPLQWLSLCCMLCRWILCRVLCGLQSCRPCNILAASLGNPVGSPVGSPVGKVSLMGSLPSCSFSRASSTTAWGLTSGTSPTGLTAWQPTTSGCTTSTTSTTWDRWVCPQPLPLMATQLRVCLLPREQMQCLEGQCLGQKEQLFGMGVLVEALSLVGWYQNDTYRISGKEKWWQQRTWVFLFSCHEADVLHNLSPLAGLAAHGFLSPPPCPPWGKEEVLMCSETQEDYFSALYVRA